MKFQFEIYLFISKPVAAVFDAVYNPQKLSKYFTPGGARGAMDAGASPTWAFHDFPGRFPVHVKKCVPNKQIAFDWQAGDGKYDTHVVFTFKKAGPKRTRVTVSDPRLTSRFGYASSVPCVAPSAVHSSAATVLLI